MEPFTHLHVHSEYSLRDSILKVSDIAKWADENNCSAIAITEHGQLSSSVEFYKQCKKNNVKPIIGIELYECDDIEIADNSRYHLIAIAKNNDGLKALYKLSTLAYTKGFYYKPRVSLKDITPYSDDLIILSGCPAGRIQRMLADETLEEGIREVEAIKIIKNYSKHFKHFYIELQSHDVEERAIMNEKLLYLAKKTNTPFVITTDAHMLKSSDIDAHAIFIQLEQERDVGETYTDCYLQNANDVHKIMDRQIGVENVNIAIGTTNYIADLCNISMDFNVPNQMPIIKVPDNHKSIADYYNHLIQEGWKKRKIDTWSDEKQKQYKERLDFEYDVLSHLSYLDYFVMLYQLIEVAKNRHIPLGISRGSGGGCLSLWVLGVTEVDSIKWDCDFARFATKGRPSQADYDLDVSKNYRKEMVEIAKELFGEDHVAPICTFNTLTRKVAFNDIGKILDSKGIYTIPYTERTKISDLVPDEGVIKDIVSVNKEVLNYYRQYPLLFDYVEKLENLPKSLGQHAAGVLITPKPILEYTALCLNKDKEIMTQLNMKNAMDDLKLCKMDFLGIKTLDTIDLTLKLTGLNWDDIYNNDFNYNDPNVYSNVYSNGKCSGVFQMETSHLAQQLMIDMKADNIEDVIAVNAMNRPAILSAGLHNVYVRNKNNPRFTEYVHPDMIEITAKTHGIMLYQENALAMFRLAGFPENEVDLARRAIGHKEKDTIIKLKSNFSAGLKKRNWNQEQIDTIWDMLELQSSYSFNRAHSTAYGMLSYITAWLKTYHPIEFMTALLSTEVGKFIQISRYINECKRLNIDVLPPLINVSDTNFSINDGKILFGLSMIKGVGVESVEQIIKNRPYSSLADFLQKNSKLDSTTVISLIKGGSFYEFNQNKMKLLLEFADHQYVPLKDFKPSKSVTGAQKQALLQADLIAKADFKNTAYCLGVFNNQKEIYDILKRQVRLKKHIDEFTDKYLQGNESDWEYETLSMYLTQDPFIEVIGHIQDFGNITSGSSTVFVGTIIEIKKRKDKKGNTYCYIDLLNHEQSILECICWSTQYTAHYDLLKKGKKIAIGGNKENSKIMVKSVIPYDDYISKFMGK